MEFTSIICPSCGAPIQVPSGRKTFFCLYCGSQIYADDGSTTVEYRLFDEARIREAEIAESLELKKLEIAEAKRRTMNRVLGLSMIVGIVMIVGGIVANHISGGQSSTARLVGWLGVLPIILASVVWIGSLDAYKEASERNNEFLRTMASFRRRK